MARRGAGGPLTRASTAGAIAAVALCGCSLSRASVPVQDICRPEPGTAMLCLMRASHTAPWYPMQVVVDGRLEVELHNDQFIEVKLSPDEHRLRVFSDHPSPEPIDLVLLDGEALILEASYLTMFGEHASLELARLETGAGRARIHDGKLVRATGSPFTVPK